MSITVMSIYDTIGNNYNKTRSADERILSRICQLINSQAPSVIADIGAGTGNYSYELARLGYHVHALEPSKTMQKQKRAHANLTWHEGFAENMPLKNNHYDGIICTMATHHFSSLETSYREMFRILKKQGRLVVFTMDPRLVDDDCWLKEYFNPQYNVACEILPALSSVVDLVESIFHAKATIVHFPLPHDLKDGFFYSAWRYPEKYLDENFLDRISCFALMDKQKNKQTIRALRQDLNDGTWDRRFGYWRIRETYNSGCYFLSIEK